MNAFDEPCGGAHFVLDETFGIMVYQEDVSRVAMALAGFSHTEADRLRKVMSKKDRESHLKDLFSFGNTIKISYRWTYFQCISIICYSGELCFISIFTPSSNYIFPVTT